VITLERVVLLHVPDTYNYGSAILGINFIHYFSLVANTEVEFVCDALTEEDVKRLIRETREVWVIKRLKMAKLSATGSTKLQKLITLRRSILNQVRDVLSTNPIGVIVLGGDDISEYYAGRRIVIELYRLRELSKRSPTFLVSQSIGPFYSWRKMAARLCLKDCQIYSRDPVSARYLREVLKLRRVFESSDLAFLDLPKQDREHARILDRYGINSGDYISIVPSGSVRLYTDDYNGYVKSWINIVKSLSESPHLKHKNIVLLPHVLTPVVDDRRIIEEIEKSLSKKYDNIIYIKDDLLPSGARMILGNGIFTIAGRMHAALSTFQMLKPAITLSYGIKYAGVIGGRLGMSDLIIKADSNPLWSTGKIAKLVKDKVEYVVNNYDNLKDRIARAVEENKQLALTQIKDVAKKMGLSEGE